MSRQESDICPKCGATKKHTIPTQGGEEAFFSCRNLKPTKEPQ